MVDPSLGIFEEMLGDLFGRSRLEPHLFQFTRPSGRGWQIERGAESGAPKYMEWFAAFGLMVTLVWLYLEFLRLLSKLNSRK